MKTFSACFLKCLIIFFALSANISRAQIPPFPVDPSLNSWSFYDATNWLSDYGYAPVGYTNIQNLSCWATDDANLYANALLIDTNVPAYLHYNVFEQYDTNLVCTDGFLWFWFSPDWDSQNIGGTGPGDWGRFIEVGQYTTNTAGWWSIYTDPDGNNIYFSGATNSTYTNYLSFPISWNSNSWHLIGLTYTESNSTLYVDGALATNGIGILFPPSHDVLTNGFTIGSDLYSGLEQVHGQIVDLETWRYSLYDLYSFFGELPADFMADDYSRVQDEITGGGMLTSDFNPPDFSSPSAPANTNLWLYLAGIETNTIGLFLMNTTPDVQYEIQSKTDLLLTNWTSEGFVFGPETTNFIEMDIPQGDRTTNLFMRIRSWQDSSGSGLPDWWQLKYFGTNNVDPYADPDGDGWNNLQEFQNGTDPTAFNTPPAPQGVTVSYNAGTGIATVSWLPSPDGVTGYVVKDSNGNTYSVSSATNSFATDISTNLPDPFDDDNLDLSFQVEAEFGSDDSDWSDRVGVERNAMSGKIISGPLGTAYLAVSALPPNTAVIHLTEIDYGILYYGGSSSPYVTNFNVPITDFTNGLYQLPNTATSGDITESFNTWFGKAVDTNGVNLTANVQLTEVYSSPQDDFQTTWLVPPFFDGRMQLKQNLIFQLRAALLDRPFQYTEISTNGGVSINFFTSPTNYAFAGYYNFSSYSDGNGGVDYEPLLNVFQPFEENYFDLNFVFNSSYLDSNGRTATGVNGDYDNGFGGLYLETGSSFNDYLEFPLAFDFTAPTTNNAAISSVLATNYTRWLSSYAFDSSLGYLPEIGITNDFSSSPSIKTMLVGVKNIFGLPFLSAEIGYAGPSVTTLNAGYSTSQSGYFYPETAQPQFQPVEYDFWSAPNANNDVFTNGTDYPGMAGLSLNHTNPLFITSVGNANFQLAGYAKLAVTNGYSGVYGYLQQYFDKAYIVTNGTVTTNQTGVLSAYGNFFATEPGQVALVTMPDVDTGARGTGTVYCISLNVDKNHDGEMDTSISGQDATSQANPMRFWVNSIYSANDNDVNPVGSILPNYAYGKIVSLRDLENFARLWICGMPTLSTNQNITVALNWQNVHGNPGINLYNSVETDGGTGYLTDTNTATQQQATTNIATNYGTYPVYVGPGLTIAQITNGATFTFPIDYFTNGSSKYFLFEGSGIGSGELMMTIFQNGNQIAQAGVWLDLHDVKDFYQRVKAIPRDPDGIPAPFNSNTSTFDEQLSDVDTSLDGNFSPSSDETKTATVFVHGSNLSLANALQNGETMFKRLYWQGYNGRFVFFYWNTLVGPWDGAIPAHYNYNEFRALKYGLALKNYVESDLPTNYAKNVIGHSMGNMVVTSALYPRGTNAGMTCRNVILMQAAVPASSFQYGASTLPELADLEDPQTTPDDFDFQWGYRKLVPDEVNATIYNIYNPNDYALSWWITNQKLNKPENLATPIPRVDLYYSWSYGSGGSLHEIGSGTLIRNVTDPQESLSFVARSRTEAVGRMATEGTIQTGNNFNVGTGTSVNLGDQRPDHSGEFTRPIQQLNSFYKFLFDHVD